MDQAMIAALPLRQNPLGRLNLVSCKELLHLVEPNESFSTFRNYHPETILLRWFNHHLRAAGSSKEVTNFTTDLMDSTNYATLLGALFPDPHPSALLEQVIASFSPSGYWRSIFERRAGLPPATPEQISRYQQSLEEEEQQRQRLELERQQAEGKITGAVATVKTVPAPVPAPATAAEAKLRLWEGDDEDDTLKKDTAPQTPEAAAQMAELKRKIEDYKEWVRSLGLEEAYMTALLSKTPSVAMQFDRELALMQLAFKYSDTDTLRRSLEKAEGLLELNIDWERRNKLKVYTATYAMMVRDFDRAAKNFLGPLPNHSDCIATFTSTELYSFEQFIFYTVVMCLVSLPRQAITEKVINAPEIRSVLHGIPHLQAYMESLYYCRYGEFFRELDAITERLRSDKYLAQHAQYFCKEMRAIAYRQYIQPYRSVTFPEMAAQFGVQQDFLENELERFIYGGKLAAKIDKRHNVVAAQRADSKGALMQTFLRQGDALMNRIHKLASTL